MLFMDVYAPLKPFACVLAFCASLFGGGPAGPSTDQERPLPPAPATLQEQYAGTWKQNGDSNCEIQLEVLASEDGTMRFRLQSSRATYAGQAEATDYWLHLGDITSANYDASVQVLILRNAAEGEEGAPLAECPEEVIVLERGKP